MEQAKMITLVTKAQSGDTDAVEQLLTYAHTPVSYQCRKFMNTPEDAEDMTQEVLLVIYQKLDTLADPAAFNGWVKRIAATRCMNAVNRTHVDLQFAEDEDGNSFVDTIEELDEQKIPDAALDNAETVRMIVELIDALPEAQRICTYLYYYDELSIKEIAELTVATENTVKSRLNYARKAIKEGVLDHEKHGIKLYGLSPLPFLLHYLRMAAQAEANEAAATACVTGVMAVNTVAAGTAAVATASTAQAVSAATAVSHGAGHAVGFLTKKLIAGIVAGVVALGGGAAAAVHLVSEFSESTPAIVCQHEWFEANCIAPRTCAVCGETEGEALGHQWADANCEVPMTCTVCGETEGAALGHTWEAATCESVQICTVCGITEGQPLGHQWANATCEAPMTCTVCNTTEGEALGHNWRDADCWVPKTCQTCGLTEGDALTPDYERNGLEAVWVEFNTPYEYVTCCSKDKSKTTVGHIVFDKYSVYKYDPDHPAVEGYVWHTVNILCAFDDDNANDYGYLIQIFYENYYDSGPRSNGLAGSVNYTVHYNGVDYTECRVVLDKNSQWESITEGSYRNGGLGWHYTLRHFFQISWLMPEGYDGFVLSFMDSSIKWEDGQYIYEFADENTLFFRFADNIAVSEVPTMHEHTHSYGYRVTEPTCVSEGYTTQICYVCGARSKSNYTDATGHDYHTTTVEPTTSSEGYDLHECKNCGKSYKDNYTDKLTQETEPGETEPETTVYYVPEGCTYIMADGTVLAAGTAIPAACSDGDRLLAPDYIYQYGYEYGESQQIEYDEETGEGAELGPRFIDSDIEGWGVCVRSTSKTSYAALLSEINGMPVLSLQYTFYLCKEMTEAPAIPDSVINLSQTFYCCYSLAVAPEIPEGVTDMSETFSACESLVLAPALPSTVIYLDWTFSDCEALITAPTIPESVRYMDGTFYGCHSLTGTIEVYATPTSYAECFAATKASIVLTGISEVLAELAATSASGNVTIKK